MKIIDNRDKTEKRSIELCNITKATVFNGYIQKHGIYLKTASSVVGLDDGNYYTWTAHDIIIDDYEPLESSLIISSIKK